MFTFQDTKFSNDTFPIALTYINWETDAIVAIELIRNVSIALGGQSFYYSFSIILFLCFELDKIVSCNRGCRRIIYLLSLIYVLISHVKYNVFENC